MKRLPAVYKFFAHFVMVGLKICYRVFGVTKAVKVYCGIANSMFLRVLMAEHHFYYSYII